MRNCTLGNWYVDSFTGFEGRAVAELVKVGEDVSDVQLEALSPDGKMVSEWVRSARIVAKAA